MNVQQDVRNEVNHLFRAARKDPLPDTALFLVGSNPLPLFAAYLALKPEKILLLGTPEVEKVMAALETLVKDMDGAVDFRKSTCNGYDPVDILEKTKGLLDGDEDCWFFYTAGTKAMAVHAYNAWRRKSVENSSHWAIYLSPMGPKLQFGVPGIPALSLAPGDGIQVPEPQFKDICRLHGIDKKLVIKDYHRKDLFRKLAGRIHDYVVTNCYAPGNPCRAYIDLLPPCHKTKVNIDLDINGKKEEFFVTELNLVNAKNLKDGTFITTFCLDEWLKALSLDTDPDFQGCSTLDGITSKLTGEEIPGAHGKRQGKRAEGLKLIATEWLEWWTADVLEETGLFHDIHDSVTFEIPGSGKTSEVDVCAMRGHTPFVFSCTVDESSYGKHKLFEVRLRAAQLGGDHARAAVVCFSNNPDGLEKQLNQGWSGYGTIKVFGDIHIRDKDKFKEEVKNWITSLEN